MPSVAAETVSASAPGAGVTAGLHPTFGLMHNMEEDKKQVTQHWVSGVSSHFGGVCGWASLLGASSGELSLPGNLPIAPRHWQLLVSASTYRQRRTVSAT